MYETDIQTTLSIRGEIVWIEYMVTENWAVEWWLNPGVYKDDYSESLLETLLRVHESKNIEEQLLSEFESRQYAEEQRLAALVENEDIPF